MKVNFVVPISEQLDQAIDQYGKNSITSFELTKDEYISLLEESNARDRILLSGSNLTPRNWKGIPLYILSLG